jgi:hypothetical protein
MLQHWKVLGFGDVCHRCSQSFPSLSLSFIRNLAIYLHLEHVIIVFFKFYFDVSMCVASYLVVVAPPCLMASLGIT